MHQPLCTYCCMIGRCTYPCSRIAHTSIDILFGRRHPTHNRIFPGVCKTLRHYLYRKMVCLKINRKVYLSLHRNMCLKLTMDKFINVLCRYVRKVLASASCSSIKRYLEEETVTTISSINTVCSIFMIIMTGIDFETSNYVVASQSIEKELTCFLKKNI